MYVRVCVIVFVGGRDRMKEVDVGGGGKRVFVCVHTSVRFLMRVHLRVCDHGMCVCV